MLLFTQPLTLFTISATKVHCQLTFSTLSSRASCTFSHELLPRLLVPSLCYKHDALIVLRIKWERKSKELNSPYSNFGQNFWLRQHLHTKYASWLFCLLCAFVCRHLKYTNTGAVFTGKSWKPPPSHCPLFPHHPLHLHFCCSYEHFSLTYPMHCKRHIRE